MILCIPTNGNQGLKDTVGEHFGRVPYYTVVNTETNAVAILPNTSEHGGGQGYPPEIMERAGVETMLCGGLGRRAIMLFEEMGIMVYIGAKGTVENAIQQWQNNQLTPATDENACQQHAFRKHSGHQH